MIATLIFILLVKLKILMSKKYVLVFIVNGLNVNRLKQDLHRV